MRMSAKRIQTAVLGLVVLWLPVWLASCGSGADMEYEAQTGIPAAFRQHSALEAEMPSAAEEAVPETIMPAAEAPAAADPSAEKGDYVLNTNTMKFHTPSCGSVSGIKAENRRTHTGTREELIAQGYDPCGSCDP